jgi:hypothetical protein
VPFTCETLWLMHLNGAPTTASPPAHPPPTATTASSAQQLSNAELIRALDKMGAATWEENFAAKADPATQERQDTIRALDKMGAATWQKKFGKAPEPSM